MGKETESQEFRERKGLIKLQGKADRIKFEMRKEILDMERANNLFFHEKELERGRIKRAEQRKMWAEKASYYRG